MDIAKRLKSLRKAHKYTQADLSKALGIPIGTYRNWEQGINTPDTPTVVKIADYFGVSTDEVLGRLDSYVEAAAAKVEIQLQRPKIVDGSVTLTGSGSFSARGEVIGPKSIPILGTIAAGIPLYAEQSVEGYLAVPPHWPVNYALRVKGESMIGAGIPDGSLVLCKAQQDVDNGQIAACIVDGEEATLKRVRRYGDVLVLQPENPAFAERTFAGEDRAVVSIQGLAIKVIRDVM